VTREKRIKMGVLYGREKRRTYKKAICCKKGEGRRQREQYNWIKQEFEEW